MMKKSHLVIGVLGTLVLQPQRELLPVALLTSGALVGSIAPDWDLRFGLPHRGLTHRLIWPGVLLLLGREYPLLVGLACGWLLHIAADMLTVEGLRPFWPARWRVHGFIKTGSWLEYVLMLPVLIGLLYLVMR